MFETILEYEFMQRALLAGITIGVISPIVGVFLVVRRLSLIADALSHVTLSGVAAGLLLQKEFPALQINPIYTGMGFAVTGSLFIEQLRRLYRSYQELAIPIILSGGIGLGVVLISAADGFNVDIAGYLFGNILAVTQEDLYTILITGLIVLLFTFLFYKEMFALSFDEEHAILSGVPRRWVNLLFTIVVALVIAAAIRVVGILLVSALMTIPVAASLQFTNSFRQTIFWSMIFSQMAVFAGLYAAYELDWASGGTIVLVSILILLLVLVIKKISLLIRNRRVIPEQK